MKRQFRKNRLAVLVILLGLLFWAGHADMAYADESDAGETRAEAKVIEVNKTCSEMIATGDDKDFFQFTTTEHGYFQVQLAHNAEDTSDTKQGWKISVLDEKENELANASGIKTNWTSFILPYAEAGRTFYVKVESNSGQYGAINCLYDLTVTQTAADNWEAEPDETRAAATGITVGKEYHGILTNGADNDYYQFTTSARGYFQIQFAHNAADTSDAKQGWKIFVLDEKGDEIVNASGIKTNWTSPILPYANAGKTFYVQVASHSGQYGAINCIYDLTVTQTAADNWEAEPNETFATATEIQTDSAYEGITLFAKDLDYYKLNVPAAGKLNVKLASFAANPSESIKHGWDVFVYDASSNEVTKMTKITTENAIAFDVKKGTYFIKISAHNTLAPIYCRYTLSTIYAKQPSKPKLSSVKPAKKSATVKWKKVSGAAGYYIYRSTSQKKGYKQVKTITKASTVSWKNKKLKSKKKYYYKIVAYTNVNGIEAVSPYSSVKSVVVK